MVDTNRELAFEELGLRQSGSLSASHCGPDVARHTSANLQYLRLPCSPERLVVLPEREYLLLEACLRSVLANKMGRSASRDELPSEVRLRIANGTAPVRAVREWRGLSGSQLARLVGISRSMLSQVECGNASVSVRTLYALSRTLSVTMESLISAGQLSHCS